MDPAVVPWLFVAHVFGFILWTGSLGGAVQILRARAAASPEAAKAFSRLEGFVGLSMDVGAALTLATGLVMLGGFEPSAIKQPWMHIKLTAVAALLAMHVRTRMRIKQGRRTTTTPVPAFFFPLLNLAVLVILVMVIVRPLAK